MTREEKKLQKLCDEASELVSENGNARDTVQKNLATLKAMADLIRAKSGQVPADVMKELDAA